MGTKKKNLVPVYKTATDFLRGKASKIFKEVTDNDSIVIVNRNSKPQNVIISYDRYVRLKNNNDIDL